MAFTAVGEAVHVGAIARAGRQRDWAHVWADAAAFGSNADTILAAGVLGNLDFVACRSAAAAIAVVLAVEVSQGDLFCSLRRGSEQCPIESGGVPWRKRCMSEWSMREVEEHWRAEAFLARNGPRR